MLLYPIKLLDPVLINAPQADRIPGGYFVIMRKPTTTFAEADPFGDVAAAAYSSLERS